MKASLDSYRSQREDFLTKVLTSLSNDDRFVAAWLTGSMSRGEEDSLSDIDISLAVADQHGPSLCQRLEQVSSKTLPERYSLFSRFGAPALIHENNNNAPEGGTFTFILYADSAIMVDWILIPHSKAQRPFQSRLLFDKVDIPVTSPSRSENLEQRKKFVAEKWAFFWMMVAITIKYIIRGDGVIATQWIENLYAMVRDIERQIRGGPWSYTRGSVSQFQPTAEKQIESLKQVCQRMQELRPKVTEFTSSELMMPVAEIETLFSFAYKTKS